MSPKTDTLAGRIAESLQIPKDLAYREPILTIIPEATDFSISA